MDYTRSVRLQLRFLDVSVECALHVAYSRAYTNSVSEVGLPIGAIIHLYNGLCYVLLACVIRVASPDGANLMHIISGHNAHNRAEMRAETAPPAV